MVSKEKSTQRNEHFIDTASGASIYTVEKRPADARPGKAVLLIHGVGAGYAYWDLDIKDYSMMEYLARERFDVFAVDQRGYGRSTRVDGLTVTGEACADDLKSVIDHIRKLRHVEKVDIVGHSFGGMVAACLAAKCPEYIGKLVLMGCPYKALNQSFQPIAAELIKLAHDGLPYAPNPHHLTIHQFLCSYEQDALDTYKALIDQLYSEWAMGIFLDLEFMNHSKYIPDIVNPTLLINGALENVVDPDDAMRCLNDLGVGEKSLLVIGNAYHLVFLEETAHRILYRAVLGWLG